jgi:hypothetical protein
MKKTYQTPTLIRRESLSSVVAGVIFISNAVKQPVNGA